MTFLDIDSMIHLKRAVFDIDIPVRGNGWAGNAKAALADLQKRLDKDYEIDLHPGDVEFFDRQFADTETVRMPRMTMKAKWNPPIVTAELRGGPKDGTLIQLPSPRFHIEFRVKKFNRDVPDFATTADSPVVQVETEELTYALAGYDTATRRHVYYATDDLSDHLRDFTRYLSA